MSDHNGSRGGPPHDISAESAYPPPPGEEDDRQRPQYQYVPPPPGSVTLPPIQDAHPAYGNRYPPPPDPRARGDYSASPTGAPNGYPPPPSSGGFNLPPVHAPPESRHYGVEHREYYRGSPYPPPPPAPAAPAPEHYNYTYHPSAASPYGGYPAEYGRGPPPPQQAAPRQRTSIACSYCRRRKIRCSGYAQTPDGQCTNCKKTGNRCIFQPVSSSSTTAFVPVSAVPGGIPPGTPLYGAFGQPLPQGGSPSAQPGGASQLPPPPGSGPGSYPPGQQPLPQGPVSQESYALPSPTGSYYPPPPEDRDARRRPHEEEHAQRLPPPNVYGENDPRRRSPASPSQGGNTPPYGYQRPNSAAYESADRGGTPRSSNSPNTPQASSQGGNGPMSLSSMMDNHPPRPPPPSDSGRDIDRTMLGRLNRRT